MNKILVVDDDQFFLELVQTALASYDVVTAMDYDSAIQALDEHQFALITLDIQLGDIDGYSICHTIRERDKDIPILFMSSLDDLESRLKAYGEGGNDYIAKPYQKPELVYKVERLIEKHMRQLELKNQLDDNVTLINSIQKEAAHLQTVNRFIQSSMHCKDIETLFAIFFIALRDLNTSGVLMIGQDTDIMQSCGGAASRLEIEILEMSNNLPRIHAFGKDRALFNWKRATLLVRELDSLIDVLAILMDSLEMVLSAIETENGLVEKIANLETANADCQHQVEELVTDMTLSLQDSLVTLGLVSDLGENEEKMINDIVEDYTQKIREKLIHQSGHSQQIRELVEQLRSPTEEIQRLLEHAKTAESETDGSAVELF